MTKRSRTTPAELRLLGLQDGASLPQGGLPVNGTLAQGTGTAVTWSDELNRLIGRLGVHFERGTFNMQLDRQVQWESPLTAEGGTHPWELGTIVLAGQAIGLAFRGNRARPELLEIVSPVRLRDALGGIAPGAAVAGHLLSGAQIPIPAA